MQVTQFDQEETFIRLFLELPKQLYQKDTLMQNRHEEESLLRGTHYLNKYVKLTKFLVRDNNRPLARCVVTEYPDDQVAYFGFFECVADMSAFHMLMEAVERYVMDSQYTALEGPLDVSLWLRYRFKTNHFDLPPYTGEPYNLAYYPQFFEDYGYNVRQKYVSNRYKALPCDTYALADYKKRWEDFETKGYEIRSPRPDEWDKSIGEIYDMICVLYRNFLSYHEISREEFTASYNSLKSIVDYDLIKLAYYRGEAVGFFMGLPNYGNLASRSKTPASALRFLQIKQHPKEYVLLYMGVMPKHHGIGMALTHCIMQELARKDVPSIGALIREGNPNYDYAKEYLIDRFEYCYYEKHFTIQDYLRRGQNRFDTLPYIFERESEDWESHTYGSFARDVRKAAHWMLKRNWQGKKIALYGRNCYAWMVLDISVMGYVGTCFPIDAQYKQNEMENIISAAQLDVLFYTPSQQDIVQALSAQFSHTAFILMDEAEQSWQAEDDSDDFALVPASRVVQVLFTSGSVARPKGVMLTQKSMFSNWKTLYRRTPMTDEDAIYLVLPLSHVYAGVAAFLYSIISGMRVYLGRMQTETCLQDFAQLHPTVFIGVPLLAERLWENIADKNNALAAFGGCMKYFYCGGASVRQALKDAYIAAGLPYLEAYGLSETSSVVALDKQGDYKKGSVGVLMESVEAVIDQPNDDGEGELLIRGGSVMSGYFAMPEKTKEVLDDKGFFHTGDLARIDESRHLYIIGRKRRLVLTSNGKNVYPQEVEELACRSNQVKRAVLFEEDNALRLKVWYTGEKSTVESYLEQLRETLPKYMRFASCEYLEDITGGRIK